ncbi:uncharacterized protein C8A04DRAFT_11844 [Dichotomopilus funicola]|uniref:Uncharacterized protein n=1 Tax=Dichotomopilus funicola TaxID=1934379 RepID=A0AAN6V3N4_9PEZI|nr:hypothetical protein C8A04DRAFT_11844 [Dichotomopilus funicola]
MAIKYSSLALVAMTAFIRPAMSSPVCSEVSSSHPASSSTPPATTTTSGGLPSSCTYRPQATTYTNEGCAFTCPPQSAWCIADAYVVLPCGCDRAAVAPTTISRCPTASYNCLQCSTGWGIATVTDPNCPPSSTATAKPTRA